MKIVLFGDSITDMGRDRINNQPNYMGSYGCGYPIFIAGELYKQDPTKHVIYNRGIGGNRIVDLYARIKMDVWNLKPDVLSILIGINDIWHEIGDKNGVDIARFERVYRMLIEDTLKVLPNVKIILCEPFVLEGSATDSTPDVPDRWERFLEIYKYAEVVKKLAEEYDLHFLPLQELFTQKAKEFGADQYANDGVHPLIPGATLIADEWVKLFREKIEK